MKIGYRIVVKKPLGEKEVICNFFLNTYTGIEFRPVNDKDIKELALYGYRAFNGMVSINNSNMDLLISKESIFIK